MNQYIALLRGINVGGKGIIKMYALRDEFERLGFSSVRTYINSGNVIFATDMADRAKIEKKIEKSLAAAFGYKTRVLIRSKKDIENTISHFPKIFDDPKWKHNIIFLSDEINSAELLDKYTLRQDIEENSYYDGVLFWSARLDAGTRAIMYKLSTKPEYQEMTVRSIGTIRKILELMNETE